MRLRPEVRVGLIVFLAFVALIGIYVFLGGLWYRVGRYILYATFRNVQTIEKGADVRMAGVKVGLVKDIVLTEDNRARVVLRIDSRYKVPEGSVARISSAGVIGDYYIEIVPSESKTYLKPGSTLKSVEIATLNDLLGQASGLMGNLSELTKDLKGTTAGLNKILGDEELARSIKQTILNLEQASASGLALTDRLNRTVTEATPDIQRLIARASLATDRLIRISDDLVLVSQGLRTGLVEGGGFAQIQEIVQNARTASTNLAEASEGLADLAGDKAFIENVKVTAEQARRATTEAADLLERLGRIGRRGKQDTEPVKKSAVPFQGLEMDTFSNVGTDSIRADVNYTFSLFRPDRFYRIGLFDVGENTRLNLQAGHPLGENSAILYGLYASRLGIGYDRRVGDKLSFQADLFWPDDLSLELKGQYNFAPDWGFLLGTDNLFDDRNLLVGVQYRK